MVESILLRRVNFSFAVLYFQVDDNTQHYFCFNVADDISIVAVYAKSLSIAIFYSLSYIEIVLLYVLTECV